MIPWEKNIATLHCITENEVTSHFWHTYNSTDEEILPSPTGGRNQQYIKIIYLQLVTVTHQQ